MPEACPRCLMTFPAHVVLRARCLKRWRGANFDAAAAEGKVGAAVAEVLGMRVKTTAELESFLRRAFVRAYATERLDPNPAAEFDTDEGQAFEFHVGLRDAGDAAREVEVREAAIRALGESRNFRYEG